MFILIIFVVLLIIFGFFAFSDIIGTDIKYNEEKITKLEDKLKFTKEEIDSSFDKLSKDYKIFKEEIASYLNEMDNEISSKFEKFKSNNNNSNLENIKSNNRNPSTKSKNVKNKNNGNKSSYNKKTLKNEK